ncbi:hypothetical protein [Pseudescherichia vulneris]|uniref:hypothetical protein n=1 Tax=Pseudescherichia vulneris TaxID=566 RepID=UPI0030C912FA
MSGFDDFQRQWLKRLSDFDLKELAVELRLMDESSSLEGYTEEERDELIGEIIRVEAENESFREQDAAEQEHYYQQKLNDRFSD